jgi:hypothetical protein
MPKLMDGETSEHSRINLLAGVFRLRRVPLLPEERRQSEREMVARAQLLHNLLPRTAFRKV